MKGKLVFVLCLLLLLSCLCFARFAQPEAKASSSLPVHNLNTGLNYSTIQEAIDANETLNGQTILVDAGEYNETVVIDKSIQLIGENSSNTVINATYDTPPIPSSVNLLDALVNITASNAEISGFNLAWGWYFVGISASTCSNITITDNKITQAGQAISLTNVTQSTIAGNVLIGMGLEGNNLFTLGSCSECIIDRNTIEGSTYQGMTLYSSNGNAIYDNLIAYNTYGIQFGGSDNGNTIYHNNFEGNYFQVFPNITGGTNGNYFNESSEGNYWSDYIGKDIDQDGIGDTPYWKLDYYPLMGPFEEFSASNCDVKTISNSTISDFQFNGTAVLFNVSGENGTTGFCRISIPTPLINGTLAVSVNGTKVPYALLPESNSTQSILYFTYHHSTQQVVVAPEFPSIPATMLFMLLTLFAVVITKKKAMRYRIH